jgi:hypothetical protein
LRRSFIFGFIIRSYGFSFADSFYFVQRLLFFLLFQKCFIFLAIFAAGSIWFFMLLGIRFNDRVSERERKENPTQTRTLLIFQLMEMRSLAEMKGGEKFRVEMDLMCGQLSLLRKRNKRFSTVF